jgi:hypothetical protein
MIGGKTCACARFAADVGERFCGGAPSSWRTKSRLGLAQGTLLGAGRRLRTWRGQKGCELAAKNKQSCYHENDY